MKAEDYYNKKFPKEQQTGIDIYDKHQMIEFATEFADQQVSITDKEIETFVAKQYGYEDIYQQGMVENAEEIDKDAELDEIRGNILLIKQAFIKLIPKLSKEPIKSEWISVEEDKENDNINVRLINSDWCIQYHKDVEEWRIYNKDSKDITPPK